MCSAVFRCSAMARRRWRIPSLLGAIAYMFGGFMVARVIHLSIFSGAALIPLLFFCVERALRSQAPRWFVAAAGAVALQTVTGHPQVPIYTALVLGLYVLVRAFERWFVGGSWRWLYLLPAQLAIIYVLGYGLAAIQLVPWVELANLSPRAAGASFDFVFNGSMHGGEWLLFVFPYLYGSIGPGPYADQAMNISLAIKTWEHCSGSHDFRGDRRPTDYWRIEDRESRRALRLCLHCHPRSSILDLRWSACAGSRHTTSRCYCS